MGGSHEGRALAEALADQGRWEIVLSFGRERDCYETPPAAETRGGFAGAEGLMTALKWRRYDAVIDASPPYDAETPAMAAAACGALGLRRLRLLRPGWALSPHTGLRIVASARAAAQAVSLSTRAFLDVGRSGIPAFRDRRDAWFLARLHAPARGRFPLPRGDFAVGRPPFSFGHETTLLRDYRIRQAVLRDEGGDAARVTLDAAQALGLSILLIERPAPPPGPIAPTVADALDWIATGR